MPLPLPNSVPPAPPDHFEQRSVEPRSLADFYTALNLTFFGQVQAASPTPRGSPEAKAALETIINGSNRTVSSAYADVLDSILGNNALDTKIDIYRWARTNRIRSDLGPVSLEFANELDREIDQLGISQSARNRIRVAIGYWDMSHKDRARYRRTDPLSAPQPQNPTYEALVEREIEAKIPPSQSRALEEARLLGQPYFYYAQRAKILPHESKLKHRIGNGQEVSLGQFIDMGSREKLMIDVGEAYSPLQSAVRQLEINYLLYYALHFRSIPLGPQRDYFASNCRPSHTLDSTYGSGDENLMGVCEELCSYFASKYNSARVSVDLVMMAKHLNKPMGKRGREGHLRTLTQLYPKLEPDDLAICERSISIGLVQRLFDDASEDRFPGVPRSKKEEHLIELYRSGAFLHYR